MNKVNNLDIKIEFFLQCVQQYFKFLENDYGLKFGKLNKRYFSEPRDALVSIRYKGGPVDVDIGWGIGYASIGITLRDNNYLEAQAKHAKKIGLKPVKVIHFETAVEFLTKGKVKSLTPEISKNISFEQMKKNADKRSDLINNSMEEIIKKLAEKLKNYGSEMLKGDTIHFPEFDKFYTEKF